MPDASGQSILISSFLAFLIKFCIQAEPVRYWDGTSAFNCAVGKWYCILVQALASTIGAVKDAGARLIAEKWLPGHDRIAAELKVYDTHPHVMDPQDPRLTSLGAKIGEPCSALLCCLPEER